MAENVLRKDLLPAATDYFEAAEALYRKLPRLEREIIGRRMIDGALDLLLCLQRSEAPECYPVERAQALYSLMEVQACLKLLNQRRTREYPEVVKMHQTAETLHQAINPNASEENSKRGSSNAAIRNYVLERLVEPAREKGLKVLTVKAGEVHKAMGLENRMPAVCTALDAAAFEEMAGVLVNNRLGPKQGARAAWELDLEG